MKQTKQLMQQALTDEVINLTDEESIQIYQNTRDSKIIAKYFIELYPTLNAMVSKCIWGTEDDRISEILLALDKALITYNGNKGAKLSSYIITCCKWYLYGIYCNHYKYKNRTLNVYSLDYAKELYDNEEFEKYIIKDYLKDYSVDFSNLEFHQLIRQCGLTDMQVKICDCIMEDNKVMFVDVCERLNITIKEFYKERKLIGKKLKFLLNNNI